MSSKSISLVADDRVSSFLKVEGNNSVSSFPLNILSFGSLFYFIFFCNLGPCYPRLQTSPGAGRPQLGTPGSILPGQEGRGAPTCCPRRAWPSLLSPHTSSFCLCWKRALKWRNLTCHLLANGSYRVPKVLRAWQSPIPKRWVHRPLTAVPPPPLQSSRNQAGWDLGVELGRP